MLLVERVLLKHRLALVAVGIIAAVALVLLGVTRDIAAALVSYGTLGALVAGAFYTSGFTTPSAMAVLVDLMMLENPVTVALLASAAAATVDCIMFFAVREALERSTRRLLKRIRRFTRRASFILPAVGFFVFGTPLPDEFALALMEMTEINPAKLFVIIFSAKLTTLLLLWTALLA